METALRDKQPRPFCAFKASLEEWKQNYFDHILMYPDPFKTSLEEWKQRIHRIMPRTIQPFKTSLEEWRVLPLATFAPEYVFSLSRSSRDGGCYIISIPTRGIMKNTAFIFG